MSGENHGLAVEANRGSSKAKEYTANNTSNEKPKSAVSESVRLFGYLMTFLYILAVIAFILLSYSLVL